MEWIIIILLSATLIFRAHQESKYTRWRAHLVNAMLEAGAYPISAKKRAFRIIDNMANFADYQDYPKLMQWLCGIYSIPLKIGEDGLVSVKTRDKLAEAMQWEMHSLKDSVRSKTNVETPELHQQGQ